MNKKLLLKVADAIEANPDLYDQTTWCERPAPDGMGETCGTTMCIAGWAVSLKGWKMVFPTDTAVHASECKKKKEGERPINDVARELLDLEYNDAETLFSSSWMKHYNAEDVADQLRRIAIGDASVYDG